MDIGLVANAVRRVGATEPRGGAERITLSTRVLLPLLQSQAAGDPALAQLARDLRALAASGGDRSVTLILPAGALNGSQPARIDLGARQFAISAALRDAVLAQLTEPAAARASATVAAVPAAVEESAGRAWAVGAQTQAATSLAGSLPVQAAIASMTGMREFLRNVAPREATAANEEPLPRVVAAQTLLGDTPARAPSTSHAEAIATRLRQQLERSGLFFESHLAQWAQGMRSGDEMRAELLQTHGLATPASAEAAAQRVAAQLSVLQQQGLALSGWAWAGQSLRLEVQREPSAADMPVEMPPVFTARLKLELPHLGGVEVHLRLAGDAIATTLSGSGAAALEDDLHALAERLRARGLTPVATQIAAERAP